MAARPTKHRDIGAESGEVFHLKPTSGTFSGLHRLWLITPELLNEPVASEVECLNWLYLNGHIGRLVTVGWVTRATGQADPLASAARTDHRKVPQRGKGDTEQQQIPVYQFNQ